MFGRALTVDAAIAGFQKSLAHLKDVVAHHRNKKAEALSLVAQHQAVANASHAEAERADAVHAKISALISA